MFPLILHTHPSAYNVEGHCVAYANAKEREENREARIAKYGKLKNIINTFYLFFTTGLTIIQPSSKFR